MAEIWGAVAAAVVGVAGSAVVANNNKPGAPTPRNLGNELGTINGQYDQLQNQLTGGQSYAGAGLSGLNNIVGGNPDIQAFLQQHPEFQDGWNKAIADQATGGGTPQAWLQSAMQVAGVPASAIPTTGGIGQVSNGLDTSNRTNTLSDVQALAPGYTDLLKSTNANYYNALNQFSASANTPYAPGASQLQAQQQAQNGFGQFNPSGLQANTQFNAMGVRAQNGNPLLSQLNQQAMAQGPSQLQTQQNGIASNLLAQGGNLSASDLRNVQQASRTAYTARGLDATNGSIVDEAMQTDAAQRARLAQNLGLAQGVQNQGLSEQNLQNTFSTNVGSQNLNYSNLNLQGQQANQAAGLQAQQLGLQGQIANQGLALNANSQNQASLIAQQNALMNNANLSTQQWQNQLQAQASAVNAQKAGTIDPYAAITSSTNQNLLPNALNLFGTTQNTQNNLLSTLYGYGSDLNNTNYNAQAAANIAGSNQNAALTGSLIGLGGQLGSSYLSSGGGSNLFGGGGSATSGLSYSY